MKTGKILFWTGLIGIGLFALGKSKVDKWGAIIEKLKIVPTSIKEITIKNWILKFKIDVNIYNNTMDDLSPIAGIVNLQKIIVTDTSKNQLAQVLINKSSINIKAGQSQKFTDLSVEIPLNISNITALSKITSLSDIKTYAVAVTPFKTYYIEQ